VARARRLLLPGAHVVVDGTSGQVGLIPGGPALFTARDEPWCKGPAGTEAG
jgi:hypothetical protein